MSFYVQSISEVDSKQLFEHKDLLLGDKNGKFAVVDENGIIYGKYVYYLKAKEHTDILNDSIPTGLENLTTEELIESTDKLCKEAQKFLKELGIL